MNEFIYWEDSWNPITKKEHVDRGFCCGNFCSRCPYSEVKKGNTTLKEEEDE